MKNKNLVIKFKGEFEIMRDEDDAYFIDDDGEKNFLGEFMRVDKNGELKSFDGVRGTSFFSSDLVKITGDGEAVKFFYCYTK